MDRVRAGLGPDSLVASDVRQRQAWRTRKLAAHARLASARAEMLTDNASEVRRSMAALQSSGVDPEIVSALGSIADDLESLAANVGGARAMRRAL